MLKKHEKRLLNVAKALRESARPELFHMDRYVNYERPGDDNNPATNICGTPACALGHFAARKDLQRLLKIEIKRHYGAGGEATMVHRTTGLEADFCDNEVLDYFGLTPAEASSLFDFDGCNDAKNPLQAAKFIENFVKNKKKADVLKEQRDVLLDKVIGLEKTIENLDPNWDPD